METLRDRNSNWTRRRQNWTVQWGKMDGRNQVSCRHVKYFQELSVVMKLLQLSLFYRFKKKMLKDTLVKLYCVSESEVGMYVCVYFKGEIDKLGLYHY